MPASLNWLNSTIVISLLGALGGVVSFFIRGYLQGQGTNKAVLAEIHRLLDVIRSHKKWYEGVPAAERPNFPLIGFTYVVYTEQVANVGILNQNLVARVVQFYGYLDFLNALQRARADHKRPADFDTLYLHSLESCDARFHDAFNTDFDRMGLPRPDESADARQIQQHRVVETGRS